MSILQNTPAAGRARRMLTTYFQILFKAACIEFEEINRMEVESIVDEILNLCQVEIANTITYHNEQDHDRTPAWKPEIETAIQKHLDKDHQDLIHKRYMETI
jgi:hypothetical protein